MIAREYECYIIDRLEVLSFISPILEPSFHRDPDSKFLFQFIYSFWLHDGYIIAGIKERFYLNSDGGVCAKSNPSFKDW